MKFYENYPLTSVFLSNLVSLSIYVLGALIIFQLGVVWLALFIAYCLFLEFRVLKGSCINCYYYGKRCAFGKGKICSLLFKRGDTKKFCMKKITWKDMIADFLVSLIPIVVGIVLLIIDFEFDILVAVALLFVLSFIGNWLVRGKLACNHCMQRKYGCPAEKLFSKKKAY